MELHPLMMKAGPETATVVNGIQPGQLSAPTPCADYDVRALLSHLIWVVSFAELAGAKQPMPSDGSLDRDRDYVQGDWAGSFSRQVDRAVAAWGYPSAWEGTTTIAAGELPAPIAASLWFTDLVVHGWDLARATGQSFEPDADVAAAIFDFASRMAEQGRQMGAFGAEFPVPESAPTLDRALGLMGRDPSWGS